MINAFLVYQLKILDDLIKEIDSKLDIFDDIVDSQASTNQHETSAVEAAWKDAKENTKR